MLGAEALIVSPVGDDELGDRAFASLRKYGVGTDYVDHDGSHPTGTVRVEVGAEGKPRFEIAKDTVGVGDSFTAAMTLGWLRGRNLDEIGRHACRVASFVCSRTGATPSLPEELRA
jgi:sugar/nucleoside kinase (ribokinase family)